MADDSDEDFDIGKNDFIDRGVSVEIALEFALAVIAVLALVKWWLAA